MDLAQNQKKNITAGLIIMLFVAFVAVAFYAVGQQQSNVPRAQVAVGPGTIIASPAPGKSLVGGITGIVTLAPAVSGGPPVGGAGGGETCLSGIKRIIIDELACGAPAKTAPGGPATVANPKDVTQISVTGFECWNGEVFAVDTGCMSKADLGTTLGPLQQQAQEFCAGKQAPSCGSGGGTGGNPPVGGPSNSCATKSQGDANCDGKIDLVDFNLWLSEFNGQSKTLNADFNSDSKVTLADFEIWRGTFTAR